jgi:hypothetical protein
MLPIQQRAMLFVWLVSLRALSVTVPHFAQARNSMRRTISVRIVMVIHDALWVEAPLEEETQVRQLMEKMMTTAAKLRVSLEVNFQ